MVEGTKISEWKKEPVKQTIQEKQSNQSQNTAINKIRQTIKKRRSVSNHWERK